MSPEAQGIAWEIVRGAGGRIEVDIAQPAEMAELPDHHKILVVYTLDSGNVVYRAYTVMEFVELVEKGSADAELAGRRIDVTGEYAAHLTGGLVRP